MKGDELVVEAIKRGYYLATQIIPVQYLESSYPPIITIPEHSLIVEQNGNLCFRRGNDVFFKGEGSGEFLGLIYDCSSDTWAKIIKSRVVSSIVQEKLRDFPVSGSVIGYNEDLFNYLKNTSRNPTDGEVVKNPIGIAWNQKYYWVFSSASSKQVYKIEQLLPFLLQDKLATKWPPPLTPDECYVCQDYPDKWCIGVTLYNFDDLTLFMRKHKSEWKNYNDDWALNVGAIFHYPSFSDFMHSSSEIESGYTMISTNQFLTHVLTHTDKQQIINPKTQENGKHKEESGSCKIQRPHLTVGDSDPIRATGIRCSKIKIQVRSGHLPD